MPRGLDQVHEIPAPLREHLLRLLERRDPAEPFEIPGCRFRLEVAPRIVRANERQRLPRTRPRPHANREPAPVRLALRVIRRAEQKEPRRRNQNQRQHSTRNPRQPRQTKTKHQKIRRCTCDCITLRPEDRVGEQRIKVEQDRRQQRPECNEHQREHTRLVDLAGRLEGSVGQEPPGAPDDHQPEHGQQQEDPPCVRDRRSQQHHDRLFLGDRLGRVIEIKAQPGQAAEQDDRVREEPPWDAAKRRAGAQERSASDDARHDQPQRVRVDQCNAGEHITAKAGPCTFLEELEQKRPAGGDGEHERGIHPRLLRVDDEHGGRGAKPRGPEPSQPAKRACADAENQADRDQVAHGRKGACRGLRIAQDAEPAREQKRLQWRARGIDLEEAIDQHRGGGGGCQPHGHNLVVPEAQTPDHAEPQRRGHDQNDRERARGLPRWASRPRIRDQGARPRHHRTPSLLRRSSSSWSSRSERRSPCESNVRL